MSIEQTPKMSKTMEHDYCLRCGRKLKSQKARELGYGAVCFRKIQSTGKRLFDEDVVVEENNFS